MSFTDFADLQKIKVFDTDEETPVGNSVIFPSNTELKYVRTKFYKHGTGLAGTEKLTLKIYLDVDRTDLLYTSKELAVADITNPDIATTDYWLGRVAFEFDPPVGISAQETYYFSMAISGYTRNADDFYIGVGCDGPNAVNVVDAQDTPVLLECFGVR